MTDLDKRLEYLSKRLTECIQELIGLKLPNNSLQIGTIIIDLNSAIHIATQMLTTGSLDLLENAIVESEHFVNKIYQERSKYNESTRNPPAEIEGNDYSDISPERFRGINSS